jgi:hypothetical protein
MQKHSEQREIETDDSSAMDELENEFEERDLQRVKGCYTLAMILALSLLILAIKIIHYCL